MEVVYRRVVKVAHNEKIGVTSLHAARLL